VQGDRVLVTGASGFVGSAVARALKARGAEVVVLARPTSPKGNLEGLGVEISYGDMTDQASVALAARGARYLFHVAADYRIWARDPEEIVRANRVGTAAVMQAAKTVGVEKIVYTSSVATLGPAPGADKDAPADETGALTEQTAVGAYKRSKVIAERIVERMAAEDGLPAVIVNPSTPIGPRDIKPTPTGRIIVEAAAGHTPAFIDTGLNLVHVDDVAQGHLLALDKGRIGERYILGGQDVELSRFFADIAHMVGRKPPRVKLPRGPLYPLAAMFEAVAQITGKEPMLTVDALNMAKRKMFYSSTKAERELGYVARPYVEGIRDALVWFREHGYVK
jgi:dihydroflavonol-4-reductase